MQSYRSTSVASNEKKPVPNIPHYAFNDKPPQSAPNCSTAADPLEKVFIPNWENRPAPIPDVLKLAGISILGHQNMSAIIANPGSGKSSIMEAIGASFINPHADGLGFEVDPSCRSIIIIDNERTNSDVWNSYSRTARRAGITVGQGFSGVLFAGLRSVARLPERLKTIEYLLENNPCSLLLIDGAGDLVYDTNDLGQAIDCRVWLREISVRFDTSLLVTIHPNPNSDKPRGHQGSEICREAECVLLVKTQNDARIITSDFQHGKNRNNPKLSSAFSWSENARMFITTNLNDVVAGRKTTKDRIRRAAALALASSILPPPTSMRRSDFEVALMKKTLKSSSTTDRTIRDLLGWGIVKKHDDDYYRLVV